jgi:cell division protein FtsB
MDSSEEVKVQTQQTEQPAGQNPAKTQGEGNTVNNTENKETPTGQPDKNAQLEAERKAANAAKEKSDLDSLKAENEKLKALIAETTGKVDTIGKELQTEKNFRLMGSLKIGEGHFGDLTALIRGNGEEVNEANITKYSEAHPEWKISGQTQTVEIGSKDEPPAHNETEREFVNRILNPNSGRLKRN